MGSEPDANEVDGILGMISFSSGSDLDALGKVLGLPRIGKTRLKRTDVRPSKGGSLFAPGKVETDDSYRSRLQDKYLNEHSPMPDFVNPPPDHPDVVELDDKDFAKAFSQAAGFASPEVVARKKQQANMMAAMRKALERGQVSVPSPQRRQCPHCGAWFTSRIASQDGCAPCTALHNDPDRGTGRTYNAVRRMCLQAMTDANKGDRFSGKEFIYFVPNQHFAKNVKQMINNRWSTWCDEWEADNDVRLKPPIRDMKLVWRFLIDVELEERAEQISRGKRVEVHYDHETRRAQGSRLPPPTAPGVASYNALGRKKDKW